MKNNGWFALAKLLTVVPILLVGYNLYHIFTIFRIYFEFYSLQDFKIGFLIKTLIDIILWLTVLCGSGLFVWGKKWGWILSVSGTFIILELIINAGGKFSDRGIGTSIMLLAGCLAVLLLITLVTNEVRRKFNIKERELAVTASIAFFSLVVAYLI